MSEIQALVDALAERLEQPVGVDDRHFRAIAYSSHTDQIDHVRVASILHRAAPVGVTEWLESLGVAEAEGPLRVPANDALEMASRICVPLRFGGTLLGYMWLLDEPDPHGDEVLSGLATDAEDLAVALYRSRRLDLEQREHRLVSALLSAEASEELAPELDELLVGAPCYGVVVLEAVNSNHEPASELSRALLADAADRLRREMDPGHLLVDLRAEQAVCILACGGTGEFDRRLEGLRAAAEQQLAAQPGWRPMVGAGDPVRDRRELADAGRRSRQSLRIAAALGLAGPVVRWGSLGSYRTIAALLGGRDVDDFVPAGIRRLSALPDAEALLITLERYLDHGGDARAAAADLFIHRSSLYGRLHKIEEAAGVDLGSGEERLELHLGLRLLRLAGSPLLPPPPDQPRR